MTAPNCAADIERMIGSVNENLAANPGYADVHNKLGLLCTLQKKYHEAHEHFQRGLMINPYYLEARLNLAFLYIEERRWEEAEIELKECVEIKPDHILSNHTLGVVFLAQGNKIRAVERFEVVAELDSFFRHQYERLGVLRGGRIALDGQNEGKLIADGLDLHQVNLRHFVGQCYVEMGETAKAIQEFKKARRAYPNDYRGPLNLGKLYDLEGEYKRAVREFQKALKLFPECGMAYAHMSYAYTGFGKLDKALEALKTAVKIHPQYADLHYQLGLLYEDFELYPEAISELTKALEVNPKYLFARINLGVLYEKNGETARALGEYEKVAALVAEDKDLVDRIDSMKKQMECPPHDLSDRVEQSKPS